jgi:hypothetical protein
MNEYRIYKDVKDTKRFEWGLNEFFPEVKYRKEKYDNSDMYLYLVIYKHKNEYHPVKYYCEKHRNY